MTDAAPDIPQTSTLPFDPAELTDLRVSQAGFARMLGVSRQTVNVMVKSGRITVGPDGLINPKRAAKEYLRNTDPMRMRVRILRDVVEDTKTLRARIVELEAELAAARERVNYLDRYAAEADRAGELFCLALRHWELALRGTEGSASWADLIEGLWDVATIAAGPNEGASSDLLLNEHTQALIEELRRAADAPPSSCDDTQPIAMVPELPGGIQGAG